MFIQSLIQTCAVRGITLSFDPEKGLHVQSPQGALTETLRAELKHHKPDIIHFLKSPKKLVANVASLGNRNPEEHSLPLVGIKCLSEKHL